MPATLPPGFREIQHQEFERLFGRLVWARFAAVPVFVGLFGWLALVEPAPWRRGLLLAALLFVPLFFVLELLRYRRQGLTQSSLPLNLTAGVLGPTLLLAASGGLASPFVYLIVLIALLVGMFVPPRGALTLLALQLAAVWTFAALGAGAVPDFNPLAFGGGSRPDAPLVHLYLHAGFLSLALLIAAVAGRGLRGAFESMLLRAAHAQQDALHAHAERAQELTALSAEIAHELKNPLASLKGLAGLLTQNLPEGGKGAERLGILRGEVERMQGILEEFLHFSRPLLPLSTMPTELGLLCAQVVALHEGLAQERQVDLVLLPGNATVRCDPRKVKQILINLVQNALEASEPGGEVSFEVGYASEGGARVLVLDRGRGLDEAQLRRLFEPGVTTKEKGSGVGLTVARALARQHGGELLLAARPGGGAIAELFLPTAPAVQQEAA